MREVYSESNLHLTGDVIVLAGGAHVEVRDQAARSGLRDGADAELPTAFTCTCIDDLVATGAPRPSLERYRAGHSGPSMCTDSSRHPVDVLCTFASFSTSLSWVGLTAGPVGVRDSPTPPGRYYRV